MNKINKSLIFITLCLSISIQGMRVSETSRVSGNYSEHLRRFLGDLRVYEDNPMNDENIAALMNDWEFLNNDEKIKAYEEAESRDIELGDLGFEKPRASKKSKLISEAKEEIKPVEFEESIEQQLEEKPEPRFLSDKAIDQLLSIIKEKHELEEKLKQEKIKYGRSKISESIYQELVDKSAELLNKNNRLKNEIEENLAKNRALENSIQRAENMLIASQEMAGSRGSAQSSVRAALFLKSANKRLASELEQLEGEKELLESELSKNK